MKNLQFISSLLFCFMVGVTSTYAGITKKTDTYETSPLAINKIVSGKEDVIVYKTKDDNIRISRFRLSPDGKYYLDLHTGEWNHVYASATNKDITDDVRSVIPSIPYSWIPDRDHHIFSGKTSYADRTKNGAKIDSSRFYIEGEIEIIEKTFYIYDVEKR